MSCAIGFIFCLIGIHLPLMTRSYECLFCASSPNHKTHDSDIKNKMIKKYYCFRALCPVFTSETIPETSGKELNEKHGALSLLL